MFRAVFISAACTLLGVSTCLSQTNDTSPSCSVTPTGQDDSALCVQLILQDGQLRVDPKQTVFVASDAFKAGLKISLGSATRLMIDDLNALFGKLPRLYWFGLTNDERDQDSKGALKSSTTDSLRHFTNSWTAFRTAEQAWRKENSQRLIDGELLEQFFAAAQAPGMIWGAAFYEGGCDPIPSLDVQKGMIPLQVADPINWNDASHFAIQVDGNTDGGLTASDIQEMLHPLEGHLWRDPDIREFIDEAAARRGTAVTVEITDASQVPKLVHVTKAARIARIVFSPPVTGGLSKTDDLDRALYILLESDLFAKVVGNHQKYIKVSALEQLNFRDLGLGGAEPLFNGRTFGAQQVELKVLGFTAGYATSGALMPADPSFVDIVLQKDTKADAAQPKQPAMTGAPNSTSPGGSSPVRTMKAPAPGPPVTMPALAAPTSTATVSLPTAETAADPSSSPSSGGSSAPQPLPPPRDKQNYIGAGFEYNPGQGVTPIVDYEYVRLFGPGSVSFQTGTNNQNPLGSGNLNFDYIGFSKPHTGSHSARADLLL